MSIFPVHAVKEHLRGKIFGLGLDRFISVGYNFRRANTSPP